MIGGSFIYVNLIKTPNAIFAILALAPTVLFGCLMSIYRGYFEGMRNMVPTAISEIIEATFKLLLDLLWHISRLSLVQINMKQQAMF